MSNTVLTNSVITKEALRVLNNELGVLDTFHRNHESEFGADVNGYAIGASVDINRPADFTVRSGATMDLQDVIEGKVTLTVDQQKGVDFKFTSKDRTLSITQFSERFIRPAMISIVNDVAKDLFEQFYQATYNWVGTPGQTINSMADFVKAPERLDELAVPRDGQSAAALSPADHWGMVGNQTGLFVQDVARPAIRTGMLGNLGGLSTWMSQVVPTHTVGAHGGTPLVNGASQNVTYDTAKNTWTQSLITDGWTASTAVIAAGDVFTLASVFMVNPKTKASTGILQQFVATAAGTSDGSGNLTLTISPPIITSGPHQTVDAAPANNAAITVVGTASTGYKQNLAYHKGAYAFAVVPMEMPEGAVKVERESMNGLSIRFIPVYDGVNDTNKYRFDILYGRKVIDPRLATRFSGTA